MNYLNATIITTLACLMLNFVATPAAAGALDVVINGKSYHLNSKYDWNEKNLGAGLEYELDSSSRWIKTLNANAFLDSSNHMSYMSGAGLKRRLYSTRKFGGFYFDAGAVAFLMARENINDYRPFPGILPVVAVGNRYIGLNITYLPKTIVRHVAHADDLDPTIGGVLFMQVKLPLKNFSPIRQRYSNAR